MNIITFLHRAGNSKEAQKHLDSKPRALMWSEPIYVTPEMAQALLDCTVEDNRKIHDHQVEKLRWALEHGKFDECYDPLCFDENGELFNGQHRAKAIVESGIGAWFYFFYDCKRTTTQDAQIVRNLGDSAVMGGILDKDLSGIYPVAIANQYLIAKYGAHKVKIMDTRTKAIFIRDHGDAIRATISISDKGKENPICKRAAVRAAIFGALLEGVDRERLERFAYCVNTGFINGDSESAAITLRNYLQNVHRGGQSTNDAIILKTQMAIRDFVNKKPRKKDYTKLESVYIDREVRA